MKKPVRLPMPSFSKVALTDTKRLLIELKYLVSCLGVMSPARLGCTEQTARVSAPAKSGLMPPFIQGCVRGHQAAAY